MSDLIIDVFYISRYACPGCIKKATYSLLKEVKIQVKLKFNKPGKLEHLTNLLKKKGWCNYYWDETSSQDNTKVSCPEVEGLQHSGYPHHTANSVNLVCGTPINIL